MSSEHAGPSSARAVPISARAVPSPVHAPWARRGLRIYDTHYIWPKPGLSGARARYGGGGARASGMGRSVPPALALPAATVRAVLRCDTVRYLWQQQVQAVRLFLASDRSQAALCSALVSACDGQPWSHAIPCYLPCDPVRACHGGGPSCTSHDVACQELNDSLA